MTGYLITGSRSGIGLESVRQLSLSAENTVVACVRSLEGDLEALRAVTEHPDVKATIHVVEVDLASPTSIASLPSRLPQDFSIDVLIQFASVLLADDRTATALDVSYDLMQKTFDSNVTGPVLLLQALHSRLPLGARVVQVSSGLASITSTAGGIIPPQFPAYNMSKAALNMFTAHASQLLKGKAIIISMDPGWVKTQMGGPNANLHAHESAGGILAVVDRLSEADSGKFFAYDGTNPPW
jgi:NAD(P)-dependent dehydrogenase (short-subunit alcohol dehydrogenase family)